MLETQYNLCNDLLSALSDLQMSSIDQHCRQQWCYVTVLLKLYMIRIPLKPDSA